MLRSLLCVALLRLYPWRCVHLAGSIPLLCATASCRWYRQLAHRRILVSLCFPPDTDTPLYEVRAELESGAKGGPGTLAAPPPPLHAGGKRHQARTDQATLCVDCTCAGAAYTTRHSAFYPVLSASLPPLSAPHCSLRWSRQRSYGASSGGASSSLLVLTAGCYRPSLRGWRRQGRF